MGAGLIVFGMATTEVIRKLRRARKDGSTIQPQSDKKDENTIKLGNFVLILGWTTAFVLGIYLFGFRIAVPAFSLSYLKWRKRRWMVAIIYAVVALGII